jgi:CheY-like chemotaxis protein
MSATNRPAEILVVDDEPIIRDYLAQTLTRRGHAVATAADGVEALEYLDHHPLPRLILLDLAMPEMDGWDFLHLRRQHPDLRGVPVVVFSAMLGVRGSDPRGLGAADVLGKPIDFQRVFEAADRYCPAGAGEQAGQ